MESHGMPGRLAIRPDDPRREPCRALLERHLAFCNQNTPPEFVFALDLSGLLQPSISFFSAADDDAVLGVGALKTLGGGHAEIKSMHTAAEARGRGVGRAIVEHLLAVAAERGLSRVSLETGSQEAFAPARALYASIGFRPCGPFADYADVPTSAFMTIEHDSEDGIWC